MDPECITSLVGYPKWGAVVFFSIFVAWLAKVLYVDVKAWSRRNEDRWEKMIERQAEHVDRHVEQMERQRQDFVHSLDKHIEVLHILGQSVQENQRVMTDNQHILTENQNFLKAIQTDLGERPYLAGDFAREVATELEAVRKDKG